MIYFLRVFGGITAIIITTWCTFATLGVITGLMCVGFGISTAMITLDLTKPPKPRHF